MKVPSLISAACLSFTSLQAAIATDYNTDGLCDIWQQFYNAWSLTPSGDEDRDGLTNLEESIAGTDPRDPKDYLRITSTQLVENNVQLKIEGIVGKQYQLLCSWGLEEDSWTPEGTPLTGTGADLTFTVPRFAEDDRRFYKVVVTDLDTDNDGVSDWAEAMTGTDPTLANSPNNASGGANSDAESLDNLMALTLSQLPGDLIASEKEGSKARFRLSRPANKNSVALKLNFFTSPHSDVTKGTASGTDYTLSSSLPSGTITGVTSGKIVFPAGETQMEIIVTPVTDTIVEVPELLAFHIPRPGFPTLNGSVTIRDADPAPEENRSLFVAFLTKEEGVETHAQGLATAQLQGDNDQATINLTFSNLTSPQNTAYLRVDSNLEITNIGNGQVTGKVWPVRAAHTRITDQAMLNALHAGQLYISITTADNPEGEIRGYFNRATGSTSFTYNPDLHDAPELGSENWMTPSGMSLERDIWRFLDQCTYGGTEALYQEVLAEVNIAISGGGTYLDGYEAWLNKQMDPVQTPNASLMQLVIAADNEEFILRGNKPIWTGNDPQLAGESYTVNRDSYGFVTSISTTVNGTYNNNHPAHTNRRREMWTLAMGAKAQVRQRMAQALSEILVISETDGTIQDRHYGAANYWDILANGAFGRYRDLLEQVTYSPMMGVYLSHIRNRAQYVSGSLTIHPDENYAREIMQLFSIGLVLRHPDGSFILGQDGLPIPTYDNSDITELARVMTGLCTGARHEAVNIQRFNGLNFAASNSQRVGPSIEIQGGANNTGVSFTSFSEGGGDRWFQAPYIYPMKALGRSGSTVYHDFGHKVLLSGKHGETVIPGQNLTGKTDAQTHLMADADLTAAHNCLAGNPASGTYNGHQNTPINVSRWLIQRLVTSNPSGGYLYRVSEVYRNTNGHLGAVTKAILLDYEARSLQQADASISYGRMKEPMLHFISILRGLNASTGIPLTALHNMSTPFSDTDAMTLSGMSKTLPQSELNKFVPGATRFRFGESTGALGQSPLRAPSVFNWFLPDFVVPGEMAEAGLYAPEMQLASETNLVNRINRLWTYTYMDLVGMVAQPGTDSGVDDIVHIASNAAVQAKVAITAPSTAASFGTNRTLTFTPDNWNQFQTVYIAAVDDATREGIHSTTILHTATTVDGNAAYTNPTLPSLNVTINDNEGSNGSVILTESDGITVVSESASAGQYTDTYTLRLSSAPTSPVTITAHGNAHLSLTPSSVVFSSNNWNTPQAVTVSAIDDTFSGELIHMGYIGHSIASADTNYADINVPGITAFIGDNDQAGSNGITVRHTEGTTIVKEGGDSDKFVVALNRQPSTATSGNVTVNISSNARVTVSPSSLTFNRDTNWWVPQIVTVTAVDNSIADGTASFNLTLSSTGGGYTSSTTAAITVHDNDSLPSGSIDIVQTGGSTVITEGAFNTSNQDSYTVRLTSRPTANVTLTISPQKHPIPISNHAKRMGYYVSDIPSSTSNGQKDRIVCDYDSLILLYKTTFTNSGGVSADNANGNTAAHFQATLALVDKLDLRWCGGLLKSQLPELTLEDLSNPQIVHPRKSIVAGVMNGFNITRGTSNSLYNNDVRDRCRIGAYLISFCPQSFIAR
jgi:uncharacterized protein (DUF1800 family)